MRRSVAGMIAIAFVQLFFSSVFAQPDKLAGRWEGKVQSIQGERPTTVVFKKDGDGYVGRTLGMRPGSEIQLKDVKIDGDKVTAKADVETPQAVVTINYTFTLSGEAMKGQGAVDLGGQNITFDIELKRVSADTDGPLAAAPAQGQSSGSGGGSGAGSGEGGQRQRVDVPQPQQKQSIDYFAGSWSFKYIGRESALWPSPREGFATFTKRADGRSLDGVIEGKHDGGAYKESLVIVFDESSKLLTYAEKLSTGVTLTSKGDWSSPISIRFTIDPVTVKGQKLQLRRIINIVAAHSFTIAEELSEDGGPFVRLGSAIFTRK